tara:strand:- start:9397 stop:10140 length:744 start_codon:yes stop_codon:yes gene_type:complete
MSYTAEELQENYKTFLMYIEDYITGDRKEKLKQLYLEHEERIMMMPASGTAHYHNCFIGGYVDHVIRVMRCALDVDELWSKHGATKDYTTEELIFSAMNHDLGKIGTEEAEQYIHNPSDWHRKNQGKLYTNNPVNAFMTVPDRGLKLLYDRGITITDNEWFGIKLHDGMYEESNKPYYVSWNPDSALRTNLPYVLHQADMMAARIESNMMTEEPVTTFPEKKAAKKSGSITESDKDNLKNTFDQLFK